MRLTRQIAGGQAISRTIGFFPEEGKLDSRKRFTSSPDLPEARGQTGTDRRRAEQEWFRLCAQNTLDESSRCDICKYV